ncbi:RES family NAD+ phosphorylase [Flavobacterium sp.]|uniref:RES family NAD+ phosphorylase n=1 Tax=Flavobacterium sp. TaxID=239 RepID=UPI00263281B3|nr:RES family NAD+ phosphorylase [Flavobacterium sp.]
MITVYNIRLEKYAGTLEASGRANRWNRQDEFVLYGASHISLAALELLAGTSLKPLAGKYVVLEIAIDVTDYARVDPKKLPENWRHVDAYADLQKLGSRWYQSKKDLVLQVPSAVVPYEYNYLVDTKHPDFNMRCQILRQLPFDFDNRFVAKNENK